MTSWSVTSGGEHADHLLEVFVFFACLVSCSFLKFFIASFVYLFLFLPLSYFLLFITWYWNKTCFSFLLSFKSQFFFLFGCICYFLALIVDICARSLEGSFHFAVSSFRSFSLTAFRSTKAESAQIKMDCLKEISFSSKRISLAYSHKNVVKVSQQQPRFSINRQTTCKL